MKPSTPTPPSDNRRAHRRLAIRLSAELTSASRRFAAVTRDLSDGGCCIEGPYPLAEGAAVRVALFVVVDDVEEATLPKMECGATVQWTAANDDVALEARHIAGLRFADLTDAQRAWLRRFLPDQK